MYVLHFGHFFENRKNSGLTLGQNDDPVTGTWKMTQMTHCLGDPMTQFHVCCVCLCLSVMCRYSIELFWWIELVFGIWVSFRPASLLRHCVIRKFRYLQKQFCVQLPTYADNIALPSFASCMLLLQQLTDVCCPQSPQQRTCGSEFIVS